MGSRFVFCWFHTSSRLIPLTSSSAEHRKTLYDFPVLRIAAYLREHIIDREDALERLSVELEDVVNSVQLVE